jgi:hypothetical protein
MTSGRPCQHVLRDVPGDAQPGDRRIRELANKLSREMDEIVERMRVEAEKIAEDTVVPRDILERMRVAGHGGGGLYRAAPSESCAVMCLVYWQCPEKTCKKEIAFCAKHGGDTTAQNEMKLHIASHRSPDAA